MATVHIPAAMRGVTVGQTDATVPGSTLGEMVEGLEALYPGLKARLVDGERIRSGLATFVDGLQVSSNLSTRIAENAEIYFAPAIAGG